MKINMITLIFVFTLSILLNVSPLTAESFRISVRTIQAEKGPAFVDASIRDLNYWFDELPFKSFKLKEEKKVNVNAGKGKRIKFQDKQKLMLKVLYRNEEKTGLTLIWKDAQNQQLLSSQIHLSPSEPLVIGLDQGKELSLIHI